MSPVYKGVIYSGGLFGGVRVHKQVREHTNTYYAVPAVLQKSVSCSACLPSPVEELANGRVQHDGTDLQTRHPIAPRLRLVAREPPALQREAHRLVPVKRVQLILCSLFEIWHRLDSREVVVSGTRRHGGHGGVGVEEGVEGLRGAPAGLLAEGGRAWQLQRRDDAAVLEPTVVMETAVVVETAAATGATAIAGAASMETAVPHDGRGLCAE